MDKLETVGAAQKERIKYIDYHSYFFGKIIRKDLQEKFGIAEAAATRDFSLYNKLAPDNLSYQPTIRAYVVSKTFHPLFDHATRDVLKSLTSDLEATLMFTHEEEFRLAPIPDMNLIATVNQAIHMGKTIECEYLSTSSGRTTKQLAPHALFDTGLHWYLRAYDKIKERFSDFVLTRMSRTTLLDESPKTIEQQAYDHEYNNVISLTICAHDNLKHPEAIEFDYNMKDGKLIKNVRASLAGYLLRRWNIDCSDSGNMKGNEYQLRLANIHELKNIKSMYFAPGFSSTAHQ